MLTGKQKQQRWWLEQRRADLYHQRKQITDAIEEINRALAAAPLTPARCHDVFDKNNPPPEAPVLAEVDTVETF